MPEIRSNSISKAWCEAVSLASGSPKREVFNLQVTLEGFSPGLPAEDLSVRGNLDIALRQAGLASVRTVASTIFPRSLWNPSRPRQELFQRYARIWPKLKLCPKNRRGTYFQRLMSYPEPSESSFNQLDHVISTYLRGNHRRSALQASVIVPQKDLNDSRQQGFPCMQQVSFVPCGGKLRVVGFYPMQYLFERGYGNYLGLLYLSFFMAQEMHLVLESVTCNSTVAVLEEAISSASVLLRQPRSSNDIQ